MNDWLPIVFGIVFLLMSSLGGIVQKAAQKAAQAQQRRDGMRRRGNARSAIEEAQAQGVTTKKRVVPEDIAAEIRKVMGLEAPPAPQPRVSVPAPERRPEPVVVEAQPERHRGHLAEELAIRDRERDQADLAFSRVDKREALGASIASRQLEGVVARSAAVAGKRNVVRRKRRVDLSNPASLLVNSEVLGKPLALRDDHLR